MAEILVGKDKTRVKKLTKVVVPGNRTIVKRVVVGTPVKTGIAAQGFLVNLSDVDGRNNLDQGTFLRYDSDLGKFKHVTLAQALGQNISVNSSGDFASLEFDSINAVFNFVGVNTSDIRGVLSARKDSSGAGDGDIEYDSATGTILYTGPETRKLVSGVTIGNDSNDFTYDSGTGVFTFRDSNFARTDLRDVYHQGILIPTSQTVNFNDSSTNIRESNGDLVIENQSGKLLLVSDSNTEITVNGQTAARFTNPAELYYAGVKKFTTLSDGVQIFGNAYVDSDLTVGGNLDVTDSASFDSNVTVRGNLNVGGIFTGSITAANVREHFSAGGDLSYDSATGKFFFDVEDVYTQANFDSDFNTSLDAAAIQGTGLTYDSTTNTLSIDSAELASYKAPIRKYFSHVDAGGDGSFYYDSTSGVFTYTGPSPAETRAHFTTGQGLQYLESTGKFYIPSSGVTAGTYGTATQVPVLTIDSLGFVDSAGLVTVAGVDSFDYDSTSGRIRISTADGQVFSQRITLDPFTTANLVEDSTNRYYTLARADSDARSALSVNDTSNYGAQSLTYDSATGKITYAGVTEANVDSTARMAISVSDQGKFGSLVYDNSSGTITYTGVDTADIRGLFNTGGDLVYDSATGKFSIDVEVVYTESNFESDLSAASTDLLPEGTNNLYYTDSRGDSIAKHAISGGNGISYSSDDGIIKISDSDDVSFNNIKLGGYIDLDVDSSNPAYKEGRLFYDNAANALSYYNNNSEVTINLGQETVVPVRNNTMYTIENGALVYITGGDSFGHPTVALARANTFATAEAVGIATNEIGIDDTGFMTTKGFVNGLNTSQFTAGAILYVNANVPGKFADSAPMSPNFPHQVGYVIDVDSTDGRVLVDLQREAFENVRITDELRVDSAIITDKIQPNLIQLDTTTYSDANIPSSLPPFQEGNLFYFQGPDALTYSNASMNVKIGQDQIVRVYNDTGSSIAKGKVVYITGAVNDFPTIALAKADNFSTVYETQGLTSHVIPDGTFGFVTLRGLYGGLNTSQFSPGDIVHVSPDSAGELVNYNPTHPNYAFEVGVVLIADSVGGGLVGGCIQVNPKAEVFETQRTQGAARFDGNVTIAGNLNILGTETKTAVANLEVADQFVYLGGGDTVVTSRKSGTGLNDVTFKGHYNGDSDVNYFVRISDAVGRDKIQWSFDSDFATVQPFDSASGPTELTLDSNDDTHLLKYGISVQVEATIGHDSGDVWTGFASPINLDFGISGNYNDSANPYTHAGFFRDATDGRFKFFNKYNPEIEGDIDVTDSSFDLGVVQAKTFIGNLTGNVTGNVTGRVSDISNFTTDDLAEGTNNLYSSGSAITNTARQALSAIDLGGDGSLSYNDSTGEITYQGPTSQDVFKHFEDQASFGDLTYDSVSKFSIDPAFVTSKPLLANADFSVDSDLVLVVDASDNNALKQASVKAIETAVSAKAQTAQLLAFIGL